MPWQVQSVDIRFGQSADGGTPVEMVTAGSVDQHQRNSIGLAGPVPGGIVFSSIAFQKEDES
jgi:hypothetical protein